MSKNNKDKNTDKPTKSVNNKQEKKISEKENVYREVTINFANTDNNFKQNKQNKKKKKKKKKRNKILKKLLIAVLIVFLIFAGIFVKRWKDNGFTLGGFVATVLGHDANTLSNLSRINILVIGQSQNLTDTILVCSYDPKIQDVSMLSIPRDTFIGRNKNNASSFDKINSLYQLDPNKLLNKVNEITGMDIKYYVKIDTSGLRELVDSIGGVYFDVPIDMDYDDTSQDLYIHVKAGYQLLDGNKAEQVVRFRHNNDGTTYPAEYGEQDLGRMKTQRAFITQVINQLAKPENITKVDDYINIANKYLECNFNLWNLKDYAPYALDFKTDNLRTGTLPGTTEKCNGLWFYIHNKKETAKIINELFKSELTDEQEKNANIKINILNGTKDEMNLDNLKNLLEESGYTVISTGKTSLTDTTTIINRTNQSSDISNKLKDVVGVGVVSNSSNGKRNVDFTIIIGADY